MTQWTHLGIEELKRQQITYSVTGILEPLAANYKPWLALVFDDKPPWPIPVVAKALPTPNNGIEGTNALTALAELAASAVEHIDTIEGITMTPTLLEGQLELTDYSTTPTTIREPAPEDIAKLGDYKKALNPEIIDIDSEPPVDSFNKPEDITRELTAELSKLEELSLDLHTVSTL